MHDLADGEQASVKGSGSSVYTLKNTGGSTRVPARPGETSRCDRAAYLQTPARISWRRRGEAAARRRGARRPSGVPRRIPMRPMRPKRAEAEERGAAAAPRARWESSIDITGWWMSEKLDGVRAYWDGKQFLSRLGNRFHAPPWFVEGFRPTPLDGELWGGRKLFQRTVSIVSAKIKRRCGRTSSTSCSMRRRSTAGSRSAWRIREALIERRRAPVRSGARAVSRATGSSTCARSSRASRRSAAKG